MKFTIWCYFRKIKIYGVENIPKEGGVLFSPNHQSAFLDPIVVGCKLNKPVTYLTRSDVFGGPFQWFMDALKMLPVYRIRDGYTNLKKNETIFENCKNLLLNNHYIMMFSEASHHEEFYLQTLSKGSSRLAYETQEKSENPIYIVPVGINYGHHRNPFCDLHLVFGEAIPITPYIKALGKKTKQINSIKATLEKNMKKCMWLPEKDEHYENRKKLIHSGNTIKSFDELKKGILNQSLGIKKRLKRQKWQSLLIKLISLPNQPPLLFIKKILELIDDVVFYSSIKMTSGLVLFPFWWATIFLFSKVMWGWKIALCVIICCVGLLYIRQILSKKYFE